MLQSGQPSNHKVKKIADAGLIIAALDRQDAHHAWAAGLLLLALVLMANVGARLLLSRRVATPR